MKLHKGAQWFSITHELARYIVSHEKDIKKPYQSTQSANEIFLHTLAWDSAFKNKINEDYKRMIDWKRGRPYTFKTEDYEKLIISDAFWARKFSEKIDESIVDRIFNYLLNQSDAS